MFFYFAVDFELDLKYQHYICDLKPAYNSE